MVQDLEAAGLLSNAITGLPKVAELIASIPAERRSQALAAVEQSYLKTAQDLGYEGADALQWSSAVMFRLHVEVLQQIEQAHRTRQAPNP
jgi:hypothetical protein